MLNKPRKFRLRWRFDYPSKQSACGMWSLTTKNPVDQAWNKNSGAVRMKIEGKDLETQQVVLLVDCPADKFRNFSWMAIARPGSGFNIGTVTPIHQLVGLEMWTSEKRIKVFDTGEIIVTPLKEEEKKLNLATYGK